MDALPGSPQIQNIIPTTFFGTDAWAAPWLGLCGGVFVFGAGMAFLEWRRQSAEQAGEGYGEGHTNEPVSEWTGSLPHPALAMAPLLLVGILNKLLTDWIPTVYGKTMQLPEGSRVEVDKLTAIWAVEGALLAAILLVAAVSFARIRAGFAAGTQSAVNGAVLAALNTGSEYGFGAVIAALPGFAAVREIVAGSVRDPLLNVAVTTNVLAGITGSASGGMSIALGAMGPTYLQNALAAGISPEVLHRVAAMASGGMDTLPHNGAVISLLMVTGLTHRQSYRDILGMTVIKTAAAFLVIGLYYWFGVQ
jgi:H+/gluconate symporter-like permease